MKKTLALLLLLAGLTVEAQGRTLYWTGDYSIYWNDLESHINWKDEDGKDTFYQEGDDVVFHNCDASFVEVWGVSPGSMLVDNSAGNSYTFDRDASGGGSINGNMNLTKRGEGDLTFECACKYTGDTFIYGGTTSINDERPSVFGDEEPARLGYGDIFLCGGRLELFSLSQPYANNIYVKGEATLNCQYLGGSLTVQNTGKLTLDAPLNGRGGNLILQDGAMVNVGGYAVSFYGGAGTGGLIAVEGNATLGNGLIISCKLNVAAGKTLTLMANTSATNGTNFNLGEGSSLDMGGNNVNFTNTTVSSSGDGANLGHGTITGVLSLTASSRINLLENTSVTGGVTLGDNASLDLGKNAISASVTLSGGFATIGNGSIEGGLTVAEGKSLALLANTTVTGGVSLGAQSSLNLGGNTFHTVGEGGSQVTFSGDATVSNGTLVLDSDWSPGYALTFTGITLDLNKHTLSKAVTLVGDNAIGNGTINTNLNVGEGDTLTLCGTLYGNHDSEDKITLGNNATLDLGGQYLDRFCYVTMKGDAFIGNGSFNSQIVVETDHKLTLSANLWGGGSIVLRNNATLDLNNHSYAGTIYGPDYDDSGTISATIGNGTLDCYLTVVGENTLNLCGDLGGSGAITLKDSATLNLGTHTLSKDVSLNGASTVKAEHTTIKALKEDTPGLLQELSVSEGHILGTGRAASLADGLYIKSEADLLIESMTLTANNEIHVGDHTITLNQVTIDLSQAKYELVGSDYYFQLQNLINCTLGMDDVVFDASGLELPTGFDPATTTVAFDFGDDVTIDPQTAKNLTLLMGNYLSTSANLDTPGQVLFTALVPIPEPTTGTLSLLALAALAARRRRK